MLSTDLDMGRASTGPEAAGAPIHLLQRAASPAPPAAASFQVTSATLTLSRGSGSTPGPSPATTGSRRLLAAEMPPPLGH